MSSKELIKIVKKKRPRQKRKRYVMSSKKLTNVLAQQRKFSNTVKGILTLNPPKNIGKQVMIRIPFNEWHERKDDVVVESFKRYIITLTDMWERDKFSKELFSLPDRFIIDYLQKFTQTNTYDYMKFLDDWLQSTI